MEIWEISTTLSREYGDVYAKYYVQAETFDLAKKKLDEKLGRTELIQDCSWKCHIDLI